MFKWVKKGSPAAAPWHILSREDDGPWQVAFLQSEITMCQFIRQASLQIVDLVPPGSGTYCRVMATPPGRCSLPEIFRLGAALPHAHMLHVSFLDFDSDADVPA